MTDRELERKLERAAYHAAPNDLLEVLSRCEPRKGTVIAMKKTMKSQTKRWLAAAACFALLMVGGGGSLIYQQSYAVASVVSLDVNPSIELKVNQNQKVLSCTALNEDAQKVLAEMDGGAALKGTKLDVAVNALVGGLVRHGYLEEVSSAILISVEDKNTERASKLEQELTTAVGDVLDKQFTAVSVLGQTLVKDEALADKAQANNISTGKAALVERILAMNNKLEFNKLAALSVEELRDLAKQGAPAMPIGKNAALKAALNYAGAGENSQVATDVDPELDENPAHYEVELYHYSLGKLEYKVDAYSGKIIRGPKDALKGAAANPAQISKAQAIEIALKQAGVKQSDVTAVFAHKDMEHNTLVWEVEFYANGMKYEYDLDAVTGAVVSFDKEKDELGVIGGADGPSGFVQTQIAKEKAFEIALKHAGCTKDQVTGLKADYDQEDAEWDVEFYVNGMEYDYSISANDGAILDWDKEPVKVNDHHDKNDYDDYYDHDDDDDDDDDDDKPVIAPPSANTDTKISESSAKAKALSHAGLSQGQVTGLKAEYDREDRTWDVEFECGGMEYDYEIGSNGSIVSWEKEPA